ncbi:MAG: mechanosensitive ion channel domain-containing protein [Casimicrobiaceae bacterium]
MSLQLSETLREWLYDPITGKLVAVLIGLVVIVVVVKILRRNVARMVHDNSARYTARKGIDFLGFVVAAALVALVFSDRLGGFTVAFGVAGAGIAFALQEVIASAAGWVAVIFGGFYRVGHRVQLGGTKGDVIDIGVLRTTLMEVGNWVNADQYTGRIVRVANSFVFKEPVYNYSSDFPFLWDEIVVPIKYGSDYRLARELLEKVAAEVVGEYCRSAQEAWEPMTRKYLIEPASVAPMVTLSANENWIAFNVRYVVDYKLRRTTKDRLFTRILETIDAHADAVGIAAATLNIEKLPAVEVRLAGREGERTGQAAQ